MRSRVAAGCGVSDLGGVEELGASVVPDYVRDDGVGDAGDEVADVFFPESGGKASR